MNDRWRLLLGVPMLIGQVAYGTDCLDYAGTVGFVTRDARYGQHEICAATDGYLWTAGWYVGLLGWNLGDLPELEPTTVLDDLPFEVSGLAVAGAGDALFVATYFLHGEIPATLSLVNVSDPSAPVVTWTEELPGETWTTAASGDLCAVANLLDGVVVADLDGVRGSLALDGRVFRVDIEGDLVAAVVDDEGLRLLDVSDPDSPFLVGQYDPAGGFDRGWVELNGNAAYLLDGDMHVLDVSDPGAPLLVRTIAGVPEASTIIRDSHLLVQASPIRVYDISDPLDPELVGHIADRLWSMAASGDFLCQVGAGGDGIGETVVTDIEPLALAPDAGQTEVPGNLHDLATSGSTVVAASGAGVITIDVGDPTEPVILATASIGPTTRVAVEGELAFAVSLSSPRQLVCLDISDPTNPVILSSAPLPNRARALAVNDGIAWVSDDDAGIQIFDVSDPSAPALLLAGFGPTDVSDVILRGDRAYVCAAGLRIYDTSMPDAPILLGEISLPSWATGRLAINPFGVVYMTRTLGDYYERIYRVDAIDVSDPGAPVHAGTVTVHEPGGMAWHSGTLLMASRVQSLMLIDVEDPADMVVLGQAPPIRWASDVVASGGYALVGGADVLQTAVLPCVTVDTPLSGVGQHRPGIRAWPEPFARTVRIQGLDPATRVDILDVGGRRVRTLIPADGRESGWAVTWDGRTDRGLATPPGVYFARVRGSGPDESRRLTLTRVTAR